ncbi:hypothetical protein ACFQ0M_48535 [Kitasatospora aburaviensis]
MDERAEGLLWSQAQAEVVAQAVSEELYRTHDGYVVVREGSRGEGRPVRHQRVSGLVGAGLLEEVPVPGSGRTLVRATADGRTALRLWQLVRPIPISKAGELERLPVLYDGDQHHRIASGASRGYYGNQAQQLLFNLRKEVTDPKEKAALRKRVDSLMRNLLVRPHAEGLGRPREPQRPAPALPLDDSDLRAVLLSLGDGTFARLATAVVRGDVRPWLRDQKDSARTVRAGARADGAPGAPAYDDLQQVERGISVRVVTPDEVRGGWSPGARWRSSSSAGCLRTRRRHFPRSVRPTGRPGSAERPRGCSTTRCSRPRWRPSPRCWTGRCCGRRPVCSAEPPAANFKRPPSPHRPHPCWKGPRRPAPRRRARPNASPAASSWRRRRI